MSDLPFGLPSSPPLPQPLFPFGPPSCPLPPDDAMASEVKDVESSNVIAGGVTIANFPQVAKNLRRSSSDDRLPISVMLTSNAQIELTYRYTLRTGFCLTCY